MENIPQQKDAAQSSQQGQAQPAQSAVEPSRVRVESIGKVRSKLGLSMRLNALMAWLLGIAALIILLGISGAIFHDPSASLKESMVFGIAMLIPVIPIFIILNKRLQQHLKETSEISSDIYYYKSAKFNMVFTGIISLIFAFLTVFNILSRLFLNGSQSGQSILNTIIFFAVPGLMAWFFYSFYAKAKQ